jgi:OOP family OmpA-OmpF porin
MNQSLKNQYIGIILITFVTVLFNDALAADIAGSQDHPMMSRFPDSEIIAYDQRYYDQTFVPSTPIDSSGKRDGDWVKGKFTWIVYQAPSGHSTLEIYRNYEVALKEAGFEMGFACKKSECGSRFIRKTFDTSGRMVGGGERWMPDSGRFLSAKLAKEEGEVWVTLLIYERNTDGLAAVRIEVIESRSPREFESMQVTTVGTKSVNYDEARMAGGLIKSGKLESTLSLEGKIEWRAFRHDASVSPYEAYASARKWAADRGFRESFDCTKQWCGSRFIRKVVDLNGNIIKGGERWSQDSEYYFLAKLVSPEKVQHLSFLAYKHPKGLTISRILTVTPTELEFNLISVTSDSLAEEIEKTGKAAVYGIYFDTDKSEVKPESEPTLLEIAKLLQSNPDMMLFVDGHTDDQGEDAYNLDLSARRAEAVVQSLVLKHGVAAERLEARGLGETAPVASNDSEEGRSWNRRVELVAR